MSKSRKILLIFGILELVGGVINLVPAVQEQADRRPEITDHRIKESGSCSCRSPFFSVTVPG